MGTGKSDLKRDVLSLTEKTFVEYYFDQSSLTFGNGTQSIIAAFGEDQFQREDGSLNYNLAAVKAHELLRLPNIYTAGMEYLNSQGFNDASVDSQHSFLVNQSADLGVKAKGIDMYNKLKGRYTEKKEIKHSGQFSLFIKSLKEKESILNGDSKA